MISAMGVMIQKVKDIDICTMKIVQVTKDRSAEQNQWSKKSNIHNLPFLT
jgi:hypothetical protein